MDKVLNKLQSIRVTSKIKNVYLEYSEIQNLMDKYNLEFVSQYNIVTDQKPELNDCREINLYVSADAIIAGRKDCSLVDSNESDSNESDSSESNEAKASEAKASEAKESEFDSSEFDSSESEKEKLCKLIYRKLCVKVHPDKNPLFSEYMVDLVKFHEQQNLFAMIVFADHFDIFFENELNDNSTLVDIEVKNIEQKIESYKKTMLWTWGNANDEKKEQIFNRFSSKVDLNFFSKREN